MTESHDKQKKPIIDFRKLLQERLDETNPRRQLAKDKTTKLAKLEGIAKKLRRGDNVKHRRLATWLTEEEYESFENDWESQQHH